MQPPQSARHIIVDFDHTLYCVSRAWEDTKERGLEEHWPHVTLWDLLDATTYFYPDALPWLRAMRERGHQLTLLSIHQGPEYSHDAEAFQKRKIVESGIGDFVDTVLVVPGKKVDYFAELFNEKPTVFIDDRPDELQAVRERYPMVDCYRLRRSDGLHRESETPPEMPEVANVAPLLHL